MFKNIYLFRYYYKSNKNSFMNIKNLFDEWVHFFIKVYSFMKNDFEVVQKVQ